MRPCDFRKLIISSCILTEDKEEERSSSSDEDDQSDVKESEVVKSNLEQENHDASISSNTEENKQDKSGSHDQGGGLHVY